MLHVAIEVSGYADLQGRKHDAVSKLLLCRKGLQEGGRSRWAMVFLAPWALGGAEQLRDRPGQGLSA